MWQDQAHQTMRATLKLPSIKDQTAFNLERWEALAHDEQVRQWPGRVETDRFGRTIMYHYAEFSHGGKQFDIGKLLSKLIPNGRVNVECPISTSDGVKVADVTWLSKTRLLKIGGKTVLKAAPEICVEVISPANTKQEIQQKKMLYFEAGAQEVWICDRKGRMFFFIADAPDVSARVSKLCPGMPKTVE